MMILQTAHLAIPGKISMDGGWVNDTPAPHIFGKAIVQMPTGEYFEDWSTDDAIFASPAQDSATFVFKGTFGTRLSRRPATAWFSVDDKNNTYSVIVAEGLSVGEDGRPKGAVIFQADKITEQSASRLYVTQKFDNSVVTPGT